MATGRTGPVRPVAVLDACVLVPAGLRDVLLSCADAGLFRPVWQDEILAETRRNTVKIRVARGADPAEASMAIDYTMGQMLTAFPGASLGAHLWVPLVPIMTCDTKDRHVLAASIGSRATHVVTANLADSPEDSWPPGVVVVSPDEFLLGLLEQDPEGVLDAITTLSGRLKKPQQSPQELAEFLAAGQHAKQFGAQLLALLT